MLLNIINIAIEVQVLLPAGAGVVLSSPVEVEFLEAVVGQGLVVLFEFVDIEGAVIAV